MKNRIIPAFFHGLMVATLFYTAIEMGYDRQLFNQITSAIRANVPVQQEDSFLLHALHSSHHLLHGREQLFQKPFTAIKAVFYYPVTFDLMTACGACGSYSRVLARILQTAGIKVRFAGMTVNGFAGGHIVIEAQTSHGWVVLDPLYDLYFITPAGMLASFSDVHKNWSYYKTQVPKGYDAAYRYEGVFYTNWNKIPVVLPAIKNLLQVLLGKEKTNTLSLRTWFLQPYQVAFYGLLFCYVCILIVMSYRKLKASRRNNKAVTINLLYNAFQSKLLQYPKRG